MFGIGLPEMLLILALALIIIGPKKLPDMAKSLGRALGEFKRATSDIKESFQAETGLDEVKESVKEVEQHIKNPEDLLDVVSNTSFEDSDDSAADSDARDTPESDADSVEEFQRPSPADEQESHPTEAQAADEESKPQDKSTP